LTISSNLFAITDKSSLGSSPLKLNLLWDHRHPGHITQMKKTHWFWCFSSPMGFTYPRTWGERYCQDLVPLISVSWQLHKAEFPFSILRRNYGFLNYRLLMGTLHSHWLRGLEFQAINKMSALAPDWPTS
jgi:hypothetical protein